MFHLDPVHIIQAAGLIGIFAIIFTETGLLVGFFLPGDSLLFAAGLLSSQGFFNPFILFAVAVVAAILGDSTGYLIGKKVGPKIFTREKSLIWNPKHIVRTQKFFNKYGSITILLARLVPIVRTFAPVLAGVGDMKYRTFISYNILGGLLWPALVIIPAYFFGNLIPHIDSYIFPIMILIVVASLIPAVIFALKKK